MVYGHSFPSSETSIQSNVEADPKTIRIFLVERMQVAHTCYDDGMLRLSICFCRVIETFADEDPAQCWPWHESLLVEPLTVHTTDSGWDISDTHRRVRMRVNVSEPPIKVWSDLLPPPDETLDIELFPDGKTWVPLMAYDQFFPQKQNSMPWPLSNGRVFPSERSFLLRATRREICWHR